MSERKPHIDLAVPDYLSKLFPDRCPSEADSERQIWIAVGAARVVRKVRQIAESQANNVLHETILDEIGGDDD